MRSITVRNVNDALSEALWWVKLTGVETPSRNGRVLRCPTPVAVTYLRPAERVMFSALRDANPFFHLMEAVWMLAGRDDVATPARYAKQIAQYSDDDITLNGAYGYRWRGWFGMDQLWAIIEMLKVDPTTRRAVLGMWSPEFDLGSVSKDIPCNTHVYFDASLGCLNMTVCCRSNDIVWGAYGANAVHFSMLQQLIAEATDIPIGRCTQFSNDLHLYLGRSDVARLYDHATKDVHYQPDDRYAVACSAVHPQRLILPDETAAMLLSDAVLFCSKPDTQDFETQFFKGTVSVMQRAHTAHKAGDKTGALLAANSVEAVDWRVACVEWLQRRAQGAQP